MFLASSFAVRVEPVQKSDVVVTDRPVIPPVQQPTGVAGEKLSSSAASKMEMKKATQPVEAPGAVSATQPVEATGAVTATRPVEASGAVTATRPVEATGDVTATRPVEASSSVTATRPVEAPGAVTATRPVEAPGIAPTVTKPTCQDTSLPFTADRPEVQPPDPASQIFTSGRREVQPPGPTGQPATVLKKHATSLTGCGVPVEEPASDAEQFSDRASSYADVGEVSDLECTGPEELSAEQKYRETFCGVRSFMGCTDVPEFDYASSSQDDDPFSGSRTSQTGKVSVKVPIDE